MLILIGFLESLVSSHVYEVIKTIYSTPASESTDAARVSVLQNTLLQLRLVNIATLDALMTHFTRLIELTSADEAYVTALAQTLAPCILRPRVETSMTMEERHGYRLIRDLFAHKDAIFGELKRASSLSHSGSITDNRPRAVSTDESNRKANMEARARAIIAGKESRSRATSPAPGPRGHRRDRSSGGPETRFPIHPSSASPADINKSRTSMGSPVRHSLEVPSTESSPIVESGTGMQPLTAVTNGSGEYNASVPPSATDGLMDEISLEKRNSLGRSGHAVAAKRLAQPRKPAGVVGRQGVDTSRQEVHEHRPVGVSLVDAPMDD